MSAIKITGEKRLVIVSGRAHPQLAIDVADELDSELVPTEARTFANGEIYARYGDSIRGADVFGELPVRPAGHEHASFLAGDLDGRHAPPSAVGLAGVPA